MTLKDVLNRDKESAFSRFGNGNWESISVRDKFGETLKVVAIKDADDIDPKYLNATFLSIGWSTIVPTRLVIRIDYSET